MAKKASSVQFAYQRAAGAFFKKVVKAIYEHGEPTNFDFAKAVVTLDDGGKYLIQIQHVGGPMLRIERPVHGLR